MSGEKNWVKIWSRGKKKTRSPLRNNGLRVYVITIRNLNSRDSTPWSSLLFG